MILEDLEHLELSQTGPNHLPKEAKQGWKGSVAVGRQA